MKAPRIFLALSVLAPALVLVHLACNADDEGASGDDVNDLGQCPAAYDAAFAKYPPSSLPTGACTPNTECYLPVDTCAVDLASPGGGVDQTVYECNCIDAGWSCYATNPIPVCQEAGAAESGVDASSEDAAVAIEGGALDGAGGDAATDAGADGSIAEASIDAGDAGDAAGD